MAQDDLSDPRKVGRKSYDEKLLRRQELSDVGWLMSHPVGRRFIWRFLKAGKIFEQTFTGNNSTFYNDGRREAMLPFLADTQRFPDLYLEMVRENNPQVEPEILKEREDEAEEAATT